MNKRRTEAEVVALIEEIREMSAGGMTPADIAEELQISLPYTYYLMDRGGISRKGMSRVPSWASHLTDEHKQEVFDRWHDTSMPVKDILTAFGLTYNQLYRVLLDLGADVTARKADAAELKGVRMEAALAMYESGAMLWLITEETGIQQPQLHAEIHKRKIPLRRKAGKKLASSEEDFKITGRVLRDPQP